MLAHIIEAILHGAAFRHTRIVEEAIRGHMVGDTQRVVIPTLVRISADADGVVAALHLIALMAVVVRIVVVVRRHALHRQRQRNNIGFARLEQRRLLVRPQCNIGLLNLSGLVRRGIVQLHHVFARYAASVGDLDPHLNFAVRGQVNGIVRGISNFPVEGGVAQAIAKWVDHIFLVPVVVAEVRLVVRFRFVVAVADVNAFLVLHIVVAGAGAAQHILVAAVRQVVAEILVGGSRSENRREGIHQTAGRIDAAVQNLAQRINTGAAGAANPNSRVNAIHLFNEAQLHRSRTVDDDNHLAELAAADNLVNQILFVLVKFKIMLPVLRARNVRAAVGSHHRTGQVKAFAADAGEDNQCHVMVRIVAVFDCGGVFGLRSFADSKTRRARADSGVGVAPLARFAAVVEAFQRRIYVKARIAQGDIQAHIIRRVAAARTGSAVHQIDGVFAEHADFHVLSRQRQGVIRVLQQHEAFVGNLLVEQHRLLERKLLLLLGGERIAIGIHIEG